MCTTYHLQHLTNTHQLEREEEAGEGGKGEGCLRVWNLSKRSSEPPQPQVTLFFTTIPLQVTLGQNTRFLQNTHLTFMVSDLLRIYIILRVYQT